MTNGANGTAAWPQEAGQIVQHMHHQHQVPLNTAKLNQSTLETDSSLASYEALAPGDITSSLTELIWGEMLHVTPKANKD